MENKEEIWKNITGFESYAISTYSKIKNIKTGKILKQGDHHAGYKIISLRNKIERKTFKVHRIVAEHFILNTENKPQVNHIAGDKSNNKVSNLEWCTAKENIQHAYKTGLMNKNFETAVKRNLIKSNLDGEIIKVYINPVDVISDGYSLANISLCCTNKRKTYKGFIWRYEYIE